MVSHIFTKTENILNVLKIKYYNGSVAFKKELLINMEFKSNGFGFQAEILTFLLLKKNSYREIKTNALHRNASNAINFKNILKVFNILIKILKLRINENN